MYSILIVDDEKIERRGIKFLLKQLGIELKVYESSNGKEALEFLKTNHVDILFTDIKMPFIDGIQLIQEVKKQNFSGKIVIFSGYEEFEYAKFATKNGVVNYILKPVDPNEFNETINRIINEITNENSENEIRNKNINFMKEHILYSLVNGTSLEDIKSKTNGLVNLDFLKSYNRFLLVEFNIEFFDKTGFDFKKTIKNDLEVQFKYLNLNSQQSLIILENNKYKYDEIKMFAINIHDIILKKYNVNCYISIGNEFNKIEDITENYKKIEAQMEKKFYNPNTFVFIDNCDDDKNIILEDNNDAILKKIKQDIKLKDINSLKNDFKNICELYSKQNELSPVFIKFRFSSILNTLYENISDITEEEFGRDIDRLYRATDFLGIIKIIDNYIEHFEQCYPKNSGSVHKEIETIKKYIYENYDKDLGADSLAAQVYLAPSYLSFIFKKETGQNLSKFIKSYRMSKAKDMLENSCEKIVDISYAVGYRNVSYFCQSFREYFGVSPQKFRNEGEAFYENA